jgi:hypothetical protein
MEEVSVTNAAKRVGWTFALAPLAFGALFACKLHPKEFPYAQMMRNSDEAWVHWGYGFYAAIRNMYPGTTLVVEVSDLVSVKHLSRLTGLPVIVENTGAERRIDDKALRAHRRFDIGHNLVAHVPFDLASGEERGREVPALLFFPSPQTSRVHIVAAGDEILVLPAELMAR